MHIDKAIKILEQVKASGVKNIILATWEADSFELTEDDPEWEALAEYIDYKHDWSGTHEDLMSTSELFKETYEQPNLE